MTENKNDKAQENAQHAPTTEINPTDLGVTDQARVSASDAQPKPASKSKKVKAIEQLKTIVAFLKCHRSDDAIESFGEYICENGLSKDAELDLFGVSLTFDFDLADFSKLSMLYNCLGEVEPDVDYADSDVPCRKEQFLLRKLVYAFYLIRCYNSLRWEFENNLPDGWSDYFDINNYDWISYSIDKDEVIQAIESIIQTIK